MSNVQFWKVSWRCYRLTAGPIRVQQMDKIHLPVSGYLSRGGHEAQRQLVVSQLDTG